MNLEYIVAALQFNERVQFRHVQPPRRNDNALALFFQDHGQPKWDANRNLRAERAILGTGTQHGH
jgi:hypothetical protein